MKRNKDKLLHLASISVYSEEFRKFVKPEPASFEIEWLEVDWLTQYDIDKIGEALKEVAEIYKASLIRKYEEAEEGNNE